MGIERASYIAEVCSALIVAMTAVLALVAYLGDFETKKAEFTFQVASQYQQAELVRTRSELFELVANAQATVAPARLGSLDLNTFLVKKIRADQSLLNTVMPNVLAITGFYNAAADCTASGLCDGELLHSLMGKEASEFSCVFMGVVTEIERATNVKNLSRGLEEISNGGCK